MQMRIMTFIPLLSTLLEMCGRACNCIHLAHLRKWDFLYHNYQIPPQHELESTFDVLGLMHGLQLCDVGFVLK